MKIPFIFKCFAVFILHVPFFVDIEDTVDTSRHTFSHTLRHNFKLRHTTVGKGGGEHGIKNFHFLAE